MTHILYIISAARSPQAVRNMEKDDFSFSPVWITEKTNTHDFGSDPVRFVDSLADYAAVAQQAVALGSSYAITGVVNPFETGAPAAALARASLGLPGPTVNQVINFSNKYAMKVLFRNAGLPTTDFALIESQDQLRHSCQSWGGSAVVKPLYGGGSAGVMLLSSGDIDECVQELSLPVLAERPCAIATEYHVDCYVNDDERTFMVSKYFQPQLHSVTQQQGYMSLMLAPTDPRVDTLLSLHQQLIDHSGISHGVFHTEFFELESGEFLISESGLRPAGGAIPHVFEKVTGIDLYRGHHRAQTVQPGYRPPHSSGHSGLLWGHCALPLNGLSPRVREQIEAIDQVVDVRENPVSATGAFLSASNGGFVFFCAPSHAELVDVASQLHVLLTAA
ncbi:ATP-grasp domain-containing protein [Corynebacterium felinum]|uniref:ATP-grasp domain-containing protein n=1 Tax=Corynebacterium felinum TaxID=131318 RepID=A0ABU2B8T4_9CORY|nr:ATP-grasp domain-containing protein [Corynebacterium felinum]MDF5819643.1 ATP-grasp domain-containing protein [Corynebacterium felinum]MDR7355042.1 hypothetical protein [Corynebacterium felinum]WJY94395.1 argininosuccinate lyase [Corynebacterium felinum]